MLSCHPVGSSPGFTASQSSKNLSGHCSGSGRMIVSGSNSDWSDQIRSSDPCRLCVFLLKSRESLRPSTWVWFCFAHLKDLWGTESHRLTHSCFKGRSDFTQTGGRPRKSSGKEGLGEVMLQCRSYLPKMVAPCISKLKAPLWKVTHFTQRVWGWLRSLIHWPYLNRVSIRDAGLRYRRRLGRPWLRHCKAWFFNEISDQASWVLVCLWMSLTSVAPPNHFGNYQCWSVYSSFASRSYISWHICKVGFFTGFLGTESLTKIH